MSELPTVKSFHGFFGADCSIDEFETAETKPRSKSIVVCERFDGRLRGHFTNRLGNVVT